MIFLPTAGLQIPAPPESEVGFFLDGLVNLLVIVAVLLVLGYLALKIWRQVAAAVRYDRRE